MSDSGIAPQAAMVRAETIANTVATAVIAAGLSWLIFHGRSEIPALAPPPDGLFGMLPGTFNFTFLVSLVLTLIVRRRVRAGVCQRLQPSEGSRWGAGLPRHVAARALVLALGVTAIGVPAGVGAVWLSIRLGWLPLSWSVAGMTAFFVLYFIVLALVVTPVTVWRALRD